MIIKAIAEGLSNKDNLGILPEGFKTKGDALEHYLTNVCLNLAKAEELMENIRGIDEMLSIVGNYMIVKKAGHLKDTDKNPGIIFEEVFFNNIDTIREQMEQFEKNLEEQERLEKERKEKGKIRKRKKRKGRDR